MDASKANETNADSPSSAGTAGYAAYRPVDKWLEEAVDAIQNAVNEMPPGPKQDLHRAWLRSARRLVIEAKVEIWKARRDEAA